MNFISLSFVALFTIVFAGRLVFGRCKTERSFVWFTMVASTVFVMWHVPVYILVMLASISVDYTAARIIDSAPTESRWRRAVLCVSMATNLLILGFFKYADFFLRTVEHSLHLMGIGVQMPRLGLILPIGISLRHRLDELHD